jgi:DNA-binding transcriptional MerR regulator
LEEVSEGMAGSDDQLKSALDIALERASKLGRMSSEEMNAAKEKELAAVGESLAMRYLEGLPIRDIELELAKHKEHRQKVVGYLVGGLIDRADPLNREGFKAVSAAIKHFIGTSTVAQQIESLLTEHRDELERTLNEQRSSVEAAELEKLKRRGISGSAVVPNIEASAEWIQVRESAISRYKKRLEELKTILKAH